MPRRIAYVFFLSSGFLLISLGLFGLSLQQAPETSKPADQVQKLVIEQIKETVVFIEADVPSAGVIPLGTGFMIQVPVPRAGKDRVLTWLVTAKHVLRSELPDHTPGPFLRQVKVRYNLKQPSQDNGSLIKEVPVDVTDVDGHLLWVIDEEDESVDLALLRFPVDAEKDEIRLITSDQILSAQMAKDLSLNENDEILFAGLFGAYMGVKKNYPIVRHGKIALVPEEKIPVKLSPTTMLVENVYLAEIMSFGGNSGSPVFLRMPPLRETTRVNLNTAYNYFLLGVMQGFVNESQPINIRFVQLQAVGTQNSGIALVVPADKILSILKSKRVEAETLWATGNTW